MRAEANEFVPSLGINPAILHRANNNKYTGLHHCCARCSPGSKVGSARPAGYLLQFRARGDLCCHSIRCMHYTMYMCVFVCLVQRRFSGHTEGMCGLINILQVDRRRFRCCLVVSGISCEPVSLSLPSRRLPCRLAPFLSFVYRQPMPYHMRDHRRATLSSARYTA